LSAGVVPFPGPPRDLAGTVRLATEQAAKTKDALGPATGYHWRRVDRLLEVGLNVREPRLTQLASATRDGMHAVGVGLHY
jgi:hypothetical protein